MKDGKQWHSKTAEEAISELNVTSKGLTTQEAQERLTQYGPNELKKEKGKSPLKLLLGQFTDILMIILLIATGLSLAGWRSNRCHHHFSHRHSQRHFRLHPRIPQRKSRGSPQKNDLTHRKCPA